ncbi:MAG: TonB-dependent receptor [Prevotellaceae bacterium]|nr:TonB-dependent receptor [Prevotellaceae bacterium]MDY5209745.1 TonB-dependent receptor [Prevotella sp.]
MIRKTLLAGSIVLFPFVCANAFERVDTAKVYDLDEVIVVAQPKESVKLRRQPLSSSVFTDNELTSLNVRDISGLSYFVPSMSIPAYGSRLTSSTYMRGIGSRSGNPAVGVYYDNIPLVNKSSFNSHFYGIDRVDVLRGPQGTLYGMNTEGGLMRVYSKNPMNYQGTDLRLSLATGLQSDVEIAHYHRPSDKFAFSTSAFYSGQKGFFDNTYLNEHADLSNEFGGKARLVWLPADGWNIDFTTDYQYVNQNGFPYGEYDSETKHFNEPQTTLLNGYKRQMVNSGLHVTYTTPSLLFASTTSHQYLYDQMVMDQDYLPEDYLQLEQRQKMNAITQELSLRSLGGGKWNHASGVFFSKQWLKTDGPVYFGEAMNNKILTNMGMPPAMAQMLTISDNYVPGTFRTPQWNVGVYHESHIKLFDRLTLTLGLRYDYQKVSIDYATQSMFTLTGKGTMMMPGQGGQMIQIPVDFTSKFVSRLENETDKGYSELLPKFGLTLDLGSGSNLYAVVSKGFRAGGYNIQMFSDIFSNEQREIGKGFAAMAKGDMTVEHTAEDYAKVEETITYKPETSWNYELGTHLNLFGGKLHADAAVYYMRVRDLQLSVMAGDYGYGRQMINAGRSSSCGVELSLRGTALDNRFTWAATYGYTHCQLLDYNDNQVPFIPTHTFSAMTDYRIGKFTFGLNVAGNGPTYWDVDNEYRQKLYATLGAHAMVDFGCIKLNVWGRNLTDTKYNTMLVNSSIDGTKRSFAQQGNPLQVGADIIMHF